MLVPCRDLALLRFYSHLQPSSELQEAAQSSETLCFAKKNTGTVAANDGGRSFLPFSVGKITPGWAEAILNSGMQAMKFPPFYVQAVLCNSL